MKNQKDWKDVLNELKIESTSSLSSDTKWIDSHAHYNVRQYNEDRNKLIKNLETQLDAIINCGTNTKTNAETINLCKEHNIFYGTIGYFPCDVLELENNPSKLDLLKTQCSNDKILGIGEIGLDYHWNSVGYGKDTIKGKKAIELQKKWFIKQIKLANELKLPVCIHSRDAEKDTLEILKKYKPEYGAVIHCYAYGLESAKEYVDMGFYFGVGGTSTYKNNEKLIEALEYIPINQIILETDCPYLTPEPKRRQRNDSGNISYVIENLAKIKNLTCDEIAEITTQNVKDVYKKIMYNMS